MNEPEAVVRADYENLTKTLIERKLTITLMESVTGGFLSSLITDTEGASQVFRGSIVAYSNDEKIRAGVSETVLKKHSVYSEEAAVEMAKAAEKRIPSDIAVGITGTTGNIDPNNVEASVPGEVFYAVSFRGDIESGKLILTQKENRYQYKLEIAKAVYEALKEKL